MTENARQSGLDVQAALPPEFEQAELLGQGAYGVVYKARQKILGQDVAIKFFPAAGNESAESNLKSFQKELRAIVRLEHPHIVKALQVGRGRESTPFIVYEYLEGNTLEDLLKDKTKVLSKEILASLFSQICSALSYAHSQGVLHRDIKPANIMLQGQSSVSFLQAKLMDFGIACLSENTEGGSSEGVQYTQTKDSAPRGSPAYMSPEQCKGEKLDVRSDIYSLACVLYQVLLGHLPFEGGSTYDLLYKQLNEKPNLPQKLLNAEMNELLEASLSKERERRPGSIVEFDGKLQLALKNWRPVKSFKLTKICALVSVILALLSAVAFLLSDRLRTAKTSLSSFKAFTASSSSSSSSSSSLTRIKLRDLARCLETAVSPDKKIKLQSESIAKLKELVPELSNDKRSLFVVHDLIGDSYLNLGKDEGARTFHQKNLELCRSYKHLPLEAMKPLVILAILARNAGDLDKAEMLAREALSVAPPGIEPVSMGLPDYYKCMHRAGVNSTCYQIISESQDKIGRRESALVFADKSINALESPWAQNFIVRPAIYKADLLLKHGQREKAERSLNHLLAQIAGQEKIDMSRYLVSNNLFFNSYDAFMFTKTCSKWFEDLGKPERSLEISQMYLNLGKRLALEEREASWYLPVKKELEDYCLELRKKLQIKKTDKVSP